MSWTYTGNDKLARVAARLYEQRTQPCKISPMVFMSDPKRAPDVLAIVRSLPKGATFIYRHFGSDARENIARELREITVTHNIQFLIGQDVKMAEKIGADGVHLPERALEQGRMLRREHPNWLLTGAAHSIQAVAQCEQHGLDAALLSPIFASESKSAGKPIGASVLADIVSKVNIPIIALGGISAETAPKLLGSGVAGMAGISMFCGHHHG